MPPFYWLSAILTEKKAHDKLVIVRLKSGREEEMICIEIILKKSRLRIGT